MFDVHLFLPMPLINNFRYRPEIDGLRAIAVMAVVLFHAGLGFPGGYIGVDVFFVISGFLITSLIIKDIEAGKFTLANFWERRARRIIPAGVVVVFAVLVAGWFLLLPSDYAGLGKSAASHTAFAANLYFWRNTNYFAGAAEEQPLLHTWSLAVEEQFYLFIPLLLLFLFRVPSLRHRGPMLAIFGLGLLVSLALSIIAVPRTPAAAFYLLPTRAWELICGSMIAVAPALPISAPRWLREMLCWIGLGTILVPCFLYTKETPFPGLAALPPCLGTALFIWASFTETPQRRNSASLILSNRSIVFIGLISYSLYLWHWPLFAFSTYWTLEELALSTRVALVAAGFVLAILSWWFVETPFRKRRWGASRQSMFGWASAGLVFSTLLAALLILNSGIPSRFSERVVAFDSAKAEALPENRFTQPVTLQDAIDQRFPRLGAAESLPVGLMVWGDSHARSILPAADQLGRERNSGVLTAWHSSTAPVLNYIPDRRFEGFSLGSDCPVFNDSVLDFITTHKVPAVLLAARWSGYFEAETELSSTIEDGTFAKMLVETVRRINAVGSKPWILMEVPNHRIPVPKALVFQEVFGSDVSRFAATPESLQIQNRKMADLIPALEAAGAGIVDVSSLLLGPGGATFSMEGNERALYYDHHHLTQNGALFVSSALMPIFDRIHHISLPRVPETSRR